MSSTANPPLFLSTSIFSRDEYRVDSLDYNYGTETIVCGLSRLEGNGDYDTLP